jgi:hypothetical protein
MMLTHDSAAPRSGSRTSVVQRRRPLGAVPSHRGCLVTARVARHASRVRVEPSAVSCQRPGPRLPLGFLRQGRSTVLPLAEHSAPYVHRRPLQKRIRQSVTIGWTVRENVRAEIRVKVWRPLFAWRAASSSRRSRRWPLR